VTDFTAEVGRRGLQPVGIEVGQHQPRPLSAGDMRDGATHPGRGTG